MNYENTVKQLRKFFTISSAAFDFADLVCSEFAENKIIKYSEMRNLHRMALTELSKEFPDLEVIDGLLKLMADLADKNNEPPKPNFPKGGC